MLLQLFQELMPYKLAFLIKQVGRQLEACMKPTCIWSARIVVAARRDAPLQLQVLVAAWQVGTPATKLINYQCTFLVGS